MIPNQPRSPFYTADHDAWRDTIRRFVEREIEPNVDTWEKAERLPRELYRKAAEIGYIAAHYPEEVGGLGADIFHMIISSQEMARAGAGGVSASLGSHAIGLPPVVRAATQAVKDRVIPQVLAGSKIAALAITEPSGGSDVANLRTTARREGDHFIVNGQKTFITSGMQADFITVAVRTGGPGMGGVSLLLIEAGMEGFSRTPLAKMGWHASDTATLYFDNVRVPAENLIGPENQGFRIIMQNFNYERLMMAAGCTGFARTCYDETVAYAQERMAFGKRLIDQQVIRHKLVDMAMRINATQAMLELLAWRIEQGDSPVAEICMLKNQATLTMEFCAREGVQTFGGAGYLRGQKVERIYREVRVNAIGGGAEEIMRDLAARQLGF
ncbi:MAG: acyl-CoA dehydrogenase family protein [Pseudomonadota bacterium]|nr:acyl-CoA dehydrogenase family protein [Pseudomonadota bacterium]